MASERLLLYLLVGETTIIKWWFHRKQVGLSRGGVANQRVGLIVGEALGQSATWGPWSGRRVSKKRIQIGKMSTHRRREKNTTSLTLTKGRKEQTGRRGKKRNRREIGDQLLPGPRGRCAGRSSRTGRCNRGNLRPARGEGDENRGEAWRISTEHWGGLSTTLPYGAAGLSFVHPSGGEGIKPGGRGEAQDQLRR